MALVELDNVWAYPKGEPGLISQALTYRPKGYVFNRAYKAGFWDGKSSLLVKEPAPKGKVQIVKFPSGLLDLVQQYRTSRGLEPLEVEDHRIPPHPHAWGDRVVALDEAQLIARDAALNATRGVIHFPTGTGKTRMMGELIRLLGMQTLVLCNATDLMKQLASELSNIIGKEVGMWGGGFDTRHDITVGMVQTITAAMRTGGAQDWLSRIQAVFVDEAHHLSADGYASVMQALTGAYYRYGMSATPHRSKNAQGDADRETYLKVTGWTGPVVASQTKEEAVEVGRIVPADIFIVGYGHTQSGRDNPDEDYDKTDRWGNPWAYSKDNPNRRNYVQDMDEYLIHHEARNQTICDIARGMMRRKQQVVVLVEREAHGHILSDALSTPFLYGGTPKAERSAQFEAFRRRDTRGLVVSKIGDEGLDLPNINVLVLAGAGRAAHRQIQRIGRGLRVSAGKERLYVFDFADRGKYLGAQYRRRRRTYESEPIFTVVDVTNEELTEWLGR